MLKQKNSCSKRADKRNFKVPTKSKYESFSMKACLASFGSSAGGNNFMGMVLIQQFVFVGIYGTSILVNVLLQTSLLRFCRKALRY